MTRRSQRGASTHTRRAFLQAAGATGAAVIAPQLVPVPLARGATRERPNLVFFLGEGARWDESSLAGNRLLKTPNIDRIGREGAVFTEAFCINSLCLPARATILSGLYSHTTGAVDNQHSRVPDRRQSSGSGRSIPHRSVCFCGSTRRTRRSIDH